MEPFSQVCCPYAIPGPNAVLTPGPNAYAATNCTTIQGIAPPPIALRPRYAMSGTDLGGAATSEDTSYGSG
eukprot:1147120-Rhodomonas_salina.2